MGKFCRNCAKLPPSAVGTPRTAFPTIFSVGDGPRAVPAQPDQQDKPKITTSLRGAQRRGNLLVLYSAPQILPGDCHAALQLAMTEVIGPGFFSPKVRQYFFDCTTERHRGRSLRKNSILRILNMSPPTSAPWPTTSAGQNGNKYSGDQNGLRFFVHFLPLTVTFDSARINLCKFIA